MTTTSHVFRVALAMLLALAFAFLVFLSMTALGDPIGPIETVVLWVFTGATGFALVRWWRLARGR